jgi:hypothetical protein
VSLTIKTLLYIAFLVALYVEETNVPVMLYVKRVKYVADWRFAAWAQRQAIDSYQAYIDEAEFVRG